MFFSQMLYLGVMGGVLLIIIIGTAYALYTEMLAEQMLED